MGENIKKLDDNELEKVSGGMTADEYRIIKRYKSIKSASLIKHDIQKCRSVFPTRTEGKTDEEVLSLMIDDNLPISGSM